MKTVVTYRAIYEGGTVDLCRSCAALPAEGTPALGEAEHGAHEGRCDGCEGRLVTAAEHRRVGQAHAAAEFSGDCAE